MNPKEELRVYLGDDFRDGRWSGSDALVVKAFKEYKGDAREFFKRERDYLYHLTVYNQEGWKQPYLDFVRGVAPPPRMVLDYGCGIGADGLMLAEYGYAPAFADYKGIATNYLRWRLRWRKLDAPVYDVEKDDIPRFPLLICLNVLAYIPGEEQIQFIDHIAGLGEIVALQMDYHRPSVYDEVKGLRYKTDVEEIETHIREKYTIVSTKTVNVFARLVAFHTPAPEASKTKIEEEVGKR